MTIFLKSKSAKAELSAAIAKDKAAQQAQDQSPLSTTKDIRGFWAQNPKTRDLFGEIVTTWRKSSARRPDCKGFWAAYPYRDWSDLTGLPIATLKRHLNTLVTHGLIERTLGRHGGNRVLTFIRPTPHALKLSKARDGDWKHLGIDPHQPEEKPKPAPVQHVAKPKKEKKKMSVAEFEAIMAEDHAEFHKKYPKLKGNIAPPD